MPRDRRFQAVACALAVVFWSCGGKDAQPDTIATDSAPETAETQPTTSEEVRAAAGNPVVAPLTVDDIGRWEEGMAGELEAVQEAAAKMKTARTDEDSLSAMMGVQEMNTLAAGAQAAGLDPERYKFVRSNLSSVAGYMTPSLGGEVVEAMRPRVVELRTKSMELVGARLKGAGML